MELRLVTTKPGAFLATITAEDYVPPQSFLNQKAAEAAARDAQHPAPWATEGARRRTEG